MTITPERLALLAKVLKATRPGAIPFCPHIPFAKQKLFMEMAEREVLYGGAAGGGKSDVLLMDCLKYVDQPGYSALILRRTYADLALPGAIMDRARSWLRPQGIHWNEKEKRFSFPSGASIVFGFLEHEDDKQRYASAEFHRIYFDELTHFTEQSYRFMLSRLRRGIDSKIPIAVRSGSNPGGIGAAWVKRYFVDKETAIDNKGRPRKFLPANLDDNIHLNRAEYRETLEELDSVTRKQLLDGNWDIDPAGLVYKGYDARLCAWPTEDPKLEEYMLGIDYGFNDECAFTVTGWKTYDPTIYIEFSEKFEDMTPSDAAAYAKELEDRYHFAKIVGDTGGLGKGYAEEARKRFSLPIEPAKKNNKRGYIDLLNGDLKKGRVKVHPSCKQLIREWSELPWDKTHEHEHPGFDNHCADSALYVWRATTAYHNGPKPDAKPPDQVIHDLTEAHWKQVSDENEGKSTKNWWEDKGW